MRNHARENAVSESMRDVPDALPRLVSFHLIGLGLLVLALVACAPIQLRTARAPAQMCDAALTSGSLERHPTSGLGIDSGDGIVLAVQWPFGYTARVDLSAAELVDETGKVVAREHDRVNVGGGMGGELGPEPFWAACGPVTVESSIGG